jgi:type IV secretory pathway VirB3-like protein
MVAALIVLAVACVALLWVCIVLWCKTLAALDEAERACRLANADYQRAECLRRGLFQPTNN